MIAKSKNYFNEILQQLASESVGILQTMDTYEKKIYLADLSTRQLRRMIPLALEIGDNESCIIIENLIKKRGHHNEL